MNVKLLACALAVSMGACNRGHEAEQRPSEQSAADDTARNARDRSGETVTPLDQSESEADRTITQHVRQGVVANDDLSTTAKNVKIVTTEGVVTLRGPVTSAEEKQEIDKLVKEVEGVKRVDNQLEIAAK